MAFKDVVMLQHIICPYQMIIQRDEVMNRDVNHAIVFLIAERFLSAVDLQVCIFVLIVEGLVLLVQILLKELFSKVCRESETQH